MKKILFYLILIVTSNSCGYNEGSNEWNIIYKNDKEGNVLIGSKTELINAIRQGQDIKIGWGAKGENHSIEHLGDPIWLAILDEKEVIAHLEPQVLSLIDWENSTANYVDATLIQSEWRVVITSKGEFDAVWYDRRGDSVTKRIPQNHVISWFSKSGANKASPLFKE